MERNGCLVREIGSTDVQIAVIPRCGSTAFQWPIVPQSDCTFVKPSIVSIFLDFQIPFKIDFTQKYSLCQKQDIKILDRV